MRRLLLLTASIALVACGGSDSTGPVASVEGTWNLQTVGGSPLPYTAAYNPSPVYRLEILGDQVVVSGDGTYVETAQIRETNGTTVTESTEQDTGTWVQHGNRVDITSDTGGTSTAVISGDKLALDTQGGAAIYARQ